MGSERPQPSRLTSLDQFRGYTVAGMFFVNFVGGYAVFGDSVFKHHHTFCSYADTIMPQFLFAVGFAYRMTLLRRIEADGPRAAYGRALSRNLGLLLLAFVIHHGSGSAWPKFSEPGLGAVLLGTFKRDLFQTLTHIAVTSIWVMPVIAARPAARVGFAAASAGLHVALSYGFNYEWVNAIGPYAGTPRGIDGGPLGFLTWSVPLLAGSLAYDAVRAHPDGAPVGRLFAWGLAVMLVAYALSCVNLRTQALPSANPELPAAEEGALLLEPPFVPPTRRTNLWTMSQRSGSVSYLTFGAGFSLALFGLFVWACDVRGWRLGLFTTLGVNALAGYVIHDLVDNAVKPFAPKDAPLWYVLAAFAAFFAICYVFLRYLEKNRLYLRL